MAGTHSLLSPSAADRWLHCTPSARLGETMPDTASEFAEEGTLAHAYCAKKLKTHLGVPVEKENMEIAEFARHHTAEMDEHTDDYAAFVLERLANARKRTRDAKLLVEQSLDLRAFIPDAQGTADALIVRDGTLEVIDFKYGKGVAVSALKNPQMMIYALGAYSRHSFDYNIRSVRMTIVQPRLGNYSSHWMTADKLMEWGKGIEGKARMAYDGEGEQNPGAWCRFCKVRAQCAALAAKGLEAAASDPHVLTAKQLAEEVLPMVPVLEAWLSSCKEYTLAQALSGVHYPGFKLVSGRSVRKITDTHGAAATLAEAGYTEEQIYRPAELKTITDLEKLVGKKLLAELIGGCITKPEGKPALVPMSDKREPIGTAADDFKGIEL